MWKQSSVLPIGYRNIDPVKYGIRFERFANQYRTNLPDVDIDFPHNLRDEVFLRLQLAWPNKVARISNHVMWHQKSATREAIRRVGHNKMIPKEALTSYIKNLPPRKDPKSLPFKKNFKTPSVTTLYTVVASYSFPKAFQKT